jgi:hypothetical protein
MAEALGAISSLLSIIKAVKTGARLINEREKIPEEIKSLQVWDPNCVSAVQHLL